MSQRNLQIKSIQEVSKDFLRGFWELENYQTSSMQIDKKIENRLERKLEKRGNKIKADLVVVNEVNESYIGDKLGTLNYKVTFYQKKKVLMTEKKFYVVYAGSSKLDLADKDKPVDICKYESHAEILIKKLWPTTGYFKIVSKRGLLELIEEEFE